MKVVTMQKGNLMVFAIYSKVLLNFICLRCQNFETKQRQPEGNLFTFFHSFRAIYLAKGNFIQGQKQLLIHCTGSILFRCQARSASQRSMCTLRPCHLGQKLCSLLHSAECGCADSLCFDCLVLSWHLQVLALYGLL